MTRLDRRWRDAALILLTQIPALFSALNPIVGDTRVYQAVAADFFSGVMPYRDRPFEYPPYALLPVLLPGLITTAALHYRYAFSLLMLLCDGLLKLRLLAIGRQWQREHSEQKWWLAYVPFALMSADAWLQDYIYTKRFDLVPVLLVTACLACVSRDRWRAAGALLGAAIATKLYPVLLAPLLLVVAWRKQRLRALIVGGLLALAPLVPLSMVLPWWGFAAMQSGRGLQVESWAASVLWLAHYFGVDAAWSWTHDAYYDVTGPWAAAAVPWVKAIWITVVTTSVAWIGWQLRKGELPIPRLAAASLCALLAFVAFGNVLSPQYMMWLVPLAGIAALGGDWRWLAPFALAMVLTPLSYPAPNYATIGLSLPRTCFLVARNACLGWSWWKLIRAV
jgi:hypothetical protein